MPVTTRRKGAAEHTGNTPNEKKQRKRTRKDPEIKPTPDAPLPSVEDEDMTSTQAQAAAATSTTSRSESIHQDESRSTSPQHIDTQPSSSSPSAHAHPSQQTSEQEPTYRYFTRQRSASVTRSVSPSMAAVNHNKRGTKRQREQSEDAADADVGPSQPANKRARSKPTPASRGRGGGKGRGGRAKPASKLQSIVEASPVRVQIPADNQTDMSPLRELQSSTSLAQPVVDSRPSMAQASPDNDRAANTFAELRSKSTIGKRRSSKIQPVGDNGYDSLSESEVQDWKPDEWREHKQLRYTARKAAPNQRPDGWQYLEYVAAQLKSGNLLSATFAQPRAPEGDEIMTDESTNAIPQTPTQAPSQQVQQSQSWIVTSAKKARNLVTYPMKFFGGAKDAGEQKTDFTFESSSTITIPPTTGSSSTGSLNAGSSNAISPSTGSSNIIPATTTSSTSDPLDPNPLTTPTSQTDHTSRTKTGRRVQFVEEKRLETIRDRHAIKRNKKFGTPIPEKSPEFEITEELKAEFQDFLNQRRGKDHGERENEVYENGPTRTFQAPDPDDESDESGFETPSSHPEFIPVFREAVELPPIPDRDTSDDTYYYTFKNHRFSRLYYAKPINLKLAKDPVFNTGYRDKLQGQWGPEMMEWWVETEKYADLRNAVKVYKDSESKWGPATYEEHEDIIAKINKFNEMIKKNKDARLAKEEASRAASGDPFANGSVKATSSRSIEEIDRHARVEDSPEDEEESVLQSKTNTQTPPPPPRPSNAQLPGQTGAAADPFTPAKPKSVFDLDKHKPKTPSLLGKYAERAYSSPVEFEKENVPEEEGGDDFQVVTLVSEDFADEDIEALGFYSGEDDVVLTAMDMDEVEWES
ncbi:hypothetical protein BDZ45DRAFT_670776 [Acephala macrosclerotiorum]|nr:hypothetical protein BDZ45DRAFT_670776 [Acephala macrosclerotiorum]